MNKIKKYKTNKSIKDLLNYVEKNNLASTEPNSYMNLFIAKNKNIFDKKLRKQIKIVHSEISYKDCSYYWKCSKSRRLDEIYQNTLGCYFTDEEDDVDEGFVEIFLCDILDMFIKKRKIIFLILDIVDYGLDDEIEDKNVYVPHTCFMILVPDKEYYSAYYINSHGKDSKIYKSYGYKFSDKKKKMIHYDEPVDAMYLSTYIHFLNKIYNTNIRYDFSDRYNYYGADYQAGDNYGICFIFPYIFWYYFGMYYDKQRSIHLKDGTVYKIESNKKMLDAGNLIECVHGFLIDINENAKKIYIQSLRSKNYNRTYYVLKINKILEKSGNYFVKKVLNLFIPYFCKK